VELFPQQVIIYDILALRRLTSKLAPQKSFEKCACFDFLLTGIADTLKLLMHLKVH
jgi:hypothetical protein